MNATKEITTLQNEIERHREIADIYSRLSQLKGNDRIFDASAMKDVHNQTANRLMQVKQVLDAKMEIK
jgi:hypothetical protein